MWTPEIHTQLVDFKMTECDETVRENPDGSYTILLNARSATNRLEEACKHAIEHIMKQDLDQEYLDVNKIEAIRHGIALEEPVPVAPVEVEEIHIDWEKIEKRIRKAKRKMATLNRYNIDEFMAIRAECENLFDLAEERYLGGYL